MVDSADIEKIDDSVVMLSARGSLKRMTEKNFERANREYTDSSSLNDIHPSVCKIKAGESVYVFTNLGNCYKVDAENVPDGKWREKGTALKELVKDLSKQEKPVFIHSFGEDMGKGNIIFFTKDGLVKKSPLKDYAVAKSSFQAIKLKDGDEVISVEFEKKNVTMLFITENGMSLNADMSDVPVQGRISGGVKGINLNSDDYCIFASQVEDVGEQIVVTDKGFAKRVILAHLDVMARYRKGVKIIDLKGSNGTKLVFSSYVAEPYVVAIESKDGMMFIDSEDISIETRTHAGRALKKGMEVTSAYAYNTNINS
jgi:DNA gyrase/topoisomerase IV subunit A